MRCSAGQPACHTAPGLGQLEQLRAAVGGVRSPDCVPTRLQSPHDVGPVVNGMPRIDASSVSVNGPERADRAQRCVAAGRDAVARELPLDELGHALVGREQLEQERRPLRAGSGDTADLLVERDERQVEHPRRVVVRHDVVARLEHRHLVGAQRRAGQRLRQARRRCARPGTAR